MKVLGDLEKAVMNAVWDGGSVTVRDVHERLEQSHGVAYTTVMTVMTRLADKQLLQRERQGSGYMYQAAQSRDGFFAGLCDRLVQDIRRDFGPSAAQAFLSEFVRRVKTFAIVALVGVTFMGGLRAAAQALPGGELCRGNSFICRGATEPQMSPVVPVSFLPQSFP